MTATVQTPADLLTTHVDEIPTNDALLYRRIVSFGSLPPAPFTALSREKIAVCDLRIQGWIGEEGERSKPLAQYRQSHAALHASALAMQGIVAMLSAGDTQLISEQKAKLIEYREQSLLCEAQLQAYEGAISAADLTLIQQALAMLDPLVGSVRVAELCLATSESVHALNGVLLFTTQQALDVADGDESVLLFMPGTGGGLQKFSSLQTLKDDVLFTLQSGLDTPFWRHIAASSRAGLMDEATSGALQLTTRVTSVPAMTYSVHMQVEGLAAATRAAIAGQRFFDDATDEVATLERLHLEWADNLQVHRNEARDQATERIAEQQRTVELLNQMPQWLLNASEAVRREYAEQLRRYHVTADVLEKQLDAALPSFDAFTRQQLAARIKADLSIEVEADQLFIDLPESAAQKLDIDQQYGSLRRGEWIPSVERVRLSLAELARHNIDPKDDEMTARLTFAQMESPADDRNTAAGLTVDYVARIIPAIDIAGQYRTLLRTVFQPQSVESPPIARKVLLEPYEQEVLLQGFAALHSKQLSAHAYQVLQWAVQARSNVDLRTHQLQMSWIVLNPGHAVNGDTNGATLSGLCVIHHEPTATTLVYLPQAPDGISLIEAPSLREAKERLINRLNAHPALVEYLVSRTDDDGRQAADKVYVDESLKRKFDGFIAFIPAIFLHMAQQQAEARAYLTYAQTKRDARSNSDIHSERMLSKDLTYRAYFRALLSFLPGLGTLFSLQDGWNDGHAAASAFGRGKKEEGELLVASASFCVLDILLSVLPGVATVAVIAKIARRTTKLRQMASVANRLPSSTRKRYVLPAFKGYEADVSMLGARKQHGIDAGTFSKDGQLWIKRNGKAYEVYRRKGEQTLRLRKVPGKSYEPPVRLDAQGGWVYHTDVGLKGGVKSSIAETLISEAHVDASFTRKQARELLDQFEFPADQQRRLELDVAVHYQSHRSMPDWVEAYRRQPTDQTVFVKPAPPKRNQPPVPGSETDRQPPQPTAGPSRGVAVTPSLQDDWKRWGRNVEESAALEPINLQPPIFRAPGTLDGEMIAMDGQYFNILPAGATRNPTIIFLKNPAAGTSLGSFSELNEVIRANRFAQPVMGSFNAGKWTVHGPLFSKKLQQLIADIRPAFTPISQRVLAEKLYQLADDSLSLTATRLMNMKATLNAWKKGHPAPLAKLNDPLTMLDSARPVNPGPGYQAINISYESSLDSFFRLDFQAGDVFDAGRLRRLGSDALSGQELTGMLARQLTSSGYEILPDGNLMQFTPTLIFRRPGLDQLYMLSVRRVHGSQITRDLMPLSLGFPMSNAWIDSFLLRYAGTAIAARISAARTQGKLIRLVGGANATRVSGHGTQLFVVRIADDF
jgi:hypothetical protein